MIRFRCELDYFRGVVRHAKSLGPDTWRKLRDKLSSMSNPHNYHMTPGYARRCVLELYKDFADHSFAFCRFNVGDDGKEQLLFNGGLIHYAGAESGVGFPQLSVTTSGRTDARWESHT